MVFRQRLVAGGHFISLWSAVRCRRLVSAAIGKRLPLFMSHGQGLANDDGQVRTKREEMSPLGEDLTRQIKFLGPLTVAQYMQSCLTHPRHGYYSTKSAVLGSKGDFVTAPEVSQVFGEMIAVWIAHVAPQLDAPQGFAVAELGPGKGTMMKDILRSLRSLHRLPRVIHMVESSTPLRNLQKQNLAEIATENSVSLHWHDSVANVPDVGTPDSSENALPTIYIAQEFFDALPVHVFQMDKCGAWRERLVDICRDETSSDSPFHFRYALARGDTPATALLGSRYIPRELSDPDTSDRAVCNEARAKSHGVSQLRGDVVEVCADGIALVELLAQRVSRAKSAALIVDYGRDESSCMMRSTLRAVHAHNLTSILSRPGLADITADVNFNHLREAVQRSDAEFHGSVTQREFLLRLGAAPRFRVLARNIADNVRLSDHEKDHMLKQLQQDYDRLVSKEHMGDIYRVAAVTHRSIQAAGF